MRTDLRFKMIDLRAGTTKILLLAKKIFSRWLKHHKQIRLSFRKAVAILLALTTFSISQTPLVALGAEATQSAQPANTLETTGESSRFLKPLQNVSNPSANPKPVPRIIPLPKEDYRATETISTLIEHVSPSQVKASLLDPKNQELAIESQEGSVPNSTLVNAFPSSRFQPGGYKLKVETYDGRSYEQDFTWGVLAINTNKSIYAPEEVAKLSLAVLDEHGRMVCDADVRLEITDPSGSKKLLSTQEGTIKVNQDCYVKGLVLRPDYEASYKTNLAGEYALRLSATTTNGTHTIVDSFSVEENAAFDVERFVPTRIYPPETYPVKINLVAKEDFEGRVREFVPASFTVASLENTTNFSKTERISLKTLNQAFKSQDVFLSQPFSGSYPTSLGFGFPHPDPLVQEKYQAAGVIGHDGLDFPLSIGTKVLAADEGIVVRAREEGNYGTTLVIQHSWGKSYYGHLSKILVEVGDFVSRSQEIALSGNSGLSPSSQPQLHFGIKFNNSDPENGYFGKVDPKPYLGIKSRAPIINTLQKRPDEEIQVISWDLSLKAGEEITLGYSFKAPNLSPQLYTLGPLSFVDQDKNFLFEEARLWKIAADDIFEGVLVYDEDGANSPASPHFRFWDGTDLDNEGQLADYQEAVATHGEVRFGQLVASPTDEELIYAANSAQGHLQVQVYENGVWTDYGDFDTSMGTTRDERWFDIAYESQSGEGLIVYEDSTTDDQVLKYQVWDGDSWSGEQTLDYSSVAEGGANDEVRWVVLEDDPGSDNILLGWQDLTGFGIYGARWNGSSNSWTHTSLINGAGVDGDAGTLTFDVAWEGSSGDGMIAYGVNNGSPSYSFDYSTYTTGGGFVDGSGLKTTGSTSQEPVWVKLEGDEDSDYIGFAAVDTVSTSSSDIGVDMWNGLDWTTITTPSDDVDINNNGDGFPFGLGWEKDDDRLMFAWRDGTTSETSLRYMVFDISVGQFLAIDDDNDAGICNLTGGDGTTQQVTALANAENSNGPCSGLGAWGTTRVTNITINGQAGSGLLMLTAINNSAPRIPELQLWDGSIDSWTTQTATMGGFEPDASDPSTVPVGKPYALAWKTINTNDPPTTPTLNDVPFDNEKTGDTTPNFEFTATDADGDDLTYQINVDDSYGFGSLVVDCVSNTSCATGGGSFTNTVTGGDTDPFNESEKIRFTTTTTLSNNTTYYWRARAQDPAGSGSYGPWSSIFSFTVVTGTSPSEWFQTTDEQFDTETLTSTQTSGSDSVQLISGGAISRLDAATSVAASTLNYSVSAGSNRILVACFSWEFNGQTDITGVTYGGQTMTQVFQQDTPDTGLSAGVACFYILDAGIQAASGTTISPTYSTAPADEIIHAASYAGVDQTGGATTVPETATAETNETTPNPFTTIDITEASGNLVIAIVTTGNATTATWQSDMTEQTDQTDASSFSSLADRLSTTNANVTVEGTIASQNRAAGGSAEFAAATVSSGTIMSPEIDFDWVTGQSTWGEASFSTTETNGDVKLRVYYTVTTACDTIVPNGTLSGNSSGFDVSASPVNIAGLTPVASTYNRICLQATLTDSGGTPFLNDWTVTWSTGGGGPTLGQLMRHGKWFDAGVEQPFTF